MSDLGLIGINVAPRYFVEGYNIGGIVKDANGVPCERVVLLFSRWTLQLPTAQVSKMVFSHKATGQFNFAVASKQFNHRQESYIIVVPDLPENTGNNAIVFDHLAAP